MISEFQLRPEKPIESGPFDVKIYVARAHLARSMPPTPVASAKKLAPRKCICPNNPKRQSTRAPAASNRAPAFLKPKARLNSIWPEPAPGSRSPPEVQNSVIFMHQSDEQDDCVTAGIKVEPGATE